MDGDANPHLALGRRGSSPLLILSFISAFSVHCTRSIAVTGARKMDAPSAPTQATAVSGVTDELSGCAELAKGDNRTLLVAQLIGVKNAVSEAPEPFRAAVAHLPGTYTFTVGDNYDYKLGVQFSVSLGKSNCTVRGIGCPIKTAKYAIATTIECGDYRDRIILNPGETQIPISYRTPGGVIALAIHLPP